jgi:antitoxin component YwqK of YwqJK toxin-antitoxin module
MSRTLLFVAIIAANMLAARGETMGLRRAWWPNGHVRTEGTFVSGVRIGEYRTYYENGAPYELRHYVGGHEQGRQQSWTATGQLYLNYDVRDGRRYGLVNALPCIEVGKEER